MITVVLIEPRKSGNVGAVARAMANFDLKNLVLINPRCKHLSQEARNRAKHAQPILKNTRVADFKYLKKFDWVIGTTAKLGRDYNIPRIPITPDKLAGLLRGKEHRKIGLLFGREASGLTNKEIQLCDFVVTIPASKKYSTLNISHATSILFYEIFKAAGKKRLEKEFPLATRKEKEIILKLIDNALNKMDFATPEKRETQRKVWKRIIGKSFLTKREAFAVIGFLKKLK